jgi:hypothetical protein
LRLGKIAENNLSVASTTWTAMGQNSDRLWGYFSPNHLAYYNCTRALSLVLLHPSIDQDGVTLKL